MVLAWWGVGGWLRVWVVEVEVGAFDTFD